jgi:KUP system potassium uptake protein
MSTEAAVRAKPEAHTQTSGTMWLTIGAIGVVYGDIGTSPLYAFREAMLTVVRHNGSFVREDVLGVVSLILWALMIIVTLKYVVILTKIDNHGEGGPLALMALVKSGFYTNTMVFTFIGMASAAFFYGDSIITPAISVLSAIEGLKVITPAFTPYVLPITVGIILALYILQARGTAKISAVFGPITVVWFLVLALTGLNHISDEPGVIAAINPYHAFRFLWDHGTLAFVTLGAIFLAVTGAEALYADLGHFGKMPIQIAWIWFVLPALTLNYLGQGALVLKDPTLLGNSFFRMVEPIHLIPLVALAAAATVIASQAVITGAYSLTRQAVNLGLLPRLIIKHTSDVHSGQIYLPQVNYMMMVGVLILVVVFKASDSLAAAYGIAVTGTMLLTAIMIFFVAWRLWEWPVAGALLFAAPLILIDGVFLSSNLLKIVDGGWMPLLVASFLMLLMVTWVQGTIILNSRSRKRDIKLEKFIASFQVKYGNLPRVPGTAFFMASDPMLTPTSLLQNIKHNHILHEKNVILSIKIEDIPYVDARLRSIVTKVNDEFTVLVMRFGFKEAPDVQEELIRLNQDRHIELHFDWETTSLFLNRRSLKSHPRYGLPLWQDFIYIWLNKSSSDPSDYYRLPIGRVIEIGRHVII